MHHEKRWPMKQSGNSSTKSDKKEPGLQRGMLRINVFACVASRCMDDVTGRCRAASRCSITCNCTQNPLCYGRTMHGILNSKLVNTTRCVKTLTQPSSSVTAINTGSLAGKCCNDSTAPQIMSVIASSKSPPAYGPLANCTLPWKYLHCSSSSFRRDSFVCKSRMKA